MDDGNTSAKDGHAKRDQSNTSGKLEKVNATSDLLDTIANKKISHQKIDKVKAHIECNINSTFDMTQALTQMKVTIPLIELLKIKEHKEVVFSVLSSILDTNTSSPKGI